jgi:AcrR family transcriptional regulator
MDASAGAGPRSDAAAGQRGRCKAPAGIGAVGRPKRGTEQERREHLLSVATRIFLAHGYGGASIELVAGAAKVSKKTIYQDYANKAALFHAVIQRRADAILHPVLEAATHDSPPETVLVAVARQIAELLALPDGIGLFRLVIAEAPRFPDLAIAFYETGPGRGLALLAAYLERQAERGRLALGDPMVAAEHFIHMAIGEMQRRALLALPPLTPADVAGRIEAALTAFMRAYGVLGKGAAS